MSTLRSLVVLDGRVDNEKIDELRDPQGEHAELDYKRLIDLTATRGKVEIAKDVAAMCVHGGYLLGGVDQHGDLTGEMDACDDRLFDESSLTPILRRYLPNSVTVSSRVVNHHGGHKVVVIYVPPHPNGYAVFRTDGKYPNDRGEDVIVFRAGEIFWRDGTRSVRITQEGMEEIISRRVAEARAGWMDEQAEIRRREREEIAAGYEARAIARAPLGTLNFSLTSEELNGAALELVRDGDRLAIKHLLSDAVGRARTILASNDDEAFGELLNKVASLAAVFVEYDVDEFFTETIDIFTSIYSLPLGPHDDRTFSLNRNISQAELAPRVFLAVIERVYALGALTVRLRKWGEIRKLTLQRPERVDDYWPNWLRHAGVMVARANHLRHTDESGQVREISLLTLAAAIATNVPELHPDTDDGDAILTSLAQFDFLSNLAAIDGAGDLDDRAYYTNWSRFRQERINPVADRIIADAEVRAAVFSERNDDELADALRALGRMARQEASRYDGFWGWDRTPVGEFIAAHPPSAN